MFITHLQLLLQSICQAFRENVHNSNTGLARITPNGGKTGFLTPKMPTPRQAGRWQIRQIYYWASAASGCLMLSNSRSNTNTEFGGIAGVGL